MSCEFLGTYNVHFLFLNTNAQIQHWIKFTIKYLKISDEQKETYNIIFTILYQNTGLTSARTSNLKIEKKLICNSKRKLQKSTPTLSTLTKEHPCVKKTP